MATLFNLVIGKNPVTLLVVLRGESIKEECEKNGIELDRPISLKRSAKNVIISSRSDFDDEADLEDIQPDYAKAIRSAGIAYKNVQAFVEQQ